MDDQVTNEAAAEESDEQPAAEVEQERYATGKKRLDDMVYKVDSGVRWISREMRSVEVEEDPNRVATGVKPLDNAVYKIDAGVKKISKGIHQAIDKK